MAAGATRGHSSHKAPTGGLQKTREPRAAVKYYYQPWAPRPDVYGHREPGPGTETNTNQVCIVYSGLLPTKCRPGTTTITRPNVPKKQMDFTPDLGKQTRTHELGSCALLPVLLLRRVIPFG